MASSIIFLSLLLCVTNLNAIIESVHVITDTYIVHVESPSASILSSTSDDLEAYYRSFLPSSNSDGGPRIVYSYRNVFHGFAARLTPEQAKAMETKRGFISARPQNILSLDTTRSPHFLGLNLNTGLWRDTNYGKGVIIGLLDTGITPNHLSFNDERMPPPPAKWKGRCDFDTNACNNKLIGARSFGGGNGSPYDENGHGTHTASIAAGYLVGGANVFCNANGIAAGIAPLAHVAMYKVCGHKGCPEGDILAGMDSAIDDGVDIISISIGQLGRPFYQEGIAVGAFAAVERGIFVSASAGNSGPYLGSIGNGAPWILTVGATTVDRKIRATAVLGSNEELEGESTFETADFPPIPLPLVYSSSCRPASLAGVQGKIVVCEADSRKVDDYASPITKGQAVKNAGGAGMIIINLQEDGYTTFSESHVLPATHLSYADGVKVKAYMNSTATPTAGILFKGTIIGDKNSPALASFSARGPNPPSRGILKPDIVGPGHNILAAWPISVENNTRTKSNFNIISGTSMACPHLSGVAALLKIAHPDWSPAEIKSAIMTTADRVNLAGNPIEDLTDLQPASVLGIGSGHVNVVKAADPGLVYDILPLDYLSYLCGLGYSDQQVKIIVRRTGSCSEIPSISEAELNYPSFVVYLNENYISQGYNGAELTCPSFSTVELYENYISRSYNRTVTNVGEANEVYTAGVVGLAGVWVSVEPMTLSFSEKKQKLTYTTTFTRLPNASSGDYVEGFLTWSSAKHSVRSPIVVVL